MKNYKKVNCKDCNVLFQSRGSRHYYCESCILLRTRISNEFINPVKDKTTWFYKRPNTISRSQIYRRKKYGKN